MLVPVAVSSVPNRYQYRTTLLNDFLRYRFEFPASTKNLLSRKSLDLPPLQSEIVSLNVENEMENVFMIHHLRNLVIFLLLMICVGCWLA